jgi:hypothetical protein
MATAMIYRQGDVLITRTTHQLTHEATAVPRDHGRIVLAYGEVTGHAHAIDDALAELFEEKDGQLYLRVSEGGATIRHEEHGAIGLAPGTYRVIRQREYSPEAIRNVAD